MKKVLETKAAEVASIKASFENSEGAILTNYNGLNVKEVTELRNSLRAAGADYKVVKNTLANIAAKELELDELSEFLSGPTAIAFAQDPAVVAKVLTDFAKSHKKLDIKAGVIGDKVITAEETKTLATLPSREVLLAQVVGAIASPISGLLNVLNGSICNLVYVLEAIRAQKEAEA